MKVNINFQGKYFRITYGIVLPIIVIASFLIISSLISRPMFSNNLISDWILRIMFSIFQSSFFIRLSRISEYGGTYPNIRWTKSDVGHGEKYLLIGVGIFTGIMDGLFVLLLIPIYFPFIKDVAFIIALIDSLLIMLPLIGQYWKFKL